MPVRTTDSIETTDPGLQFSADGQAWTIAPGVLVSSDDNDGVTGLLYDSVRLTNYGTILAPLDAGAAFAGDDVVVTNGLHALISGIYGLGFAGGDDAFVVNEGEIDAYFVGVAFNGGSDVSLANSGTITAVVLGVNVETASGEAHIANFGTIGAYGAGIRVATASDLVTEILNDGLIRGGGTDEGAGIVSESGSVSLDNHGQIDGGIKLKAADGNDFVSNVGLIRGEVSLGGGNDLYNGAEGIQRFVFGEDGDDVIFGGVRGEVISGGAGDDALSGGQGKDTLIGGTGADEFLFITECRGKHDRDMIEDFSQAEGDKIVLDRDVFTHLGKAGVLKAKYFDLGKKPEHKNDRIVYNEKKGVLLYAEKGSKTDKSDWVKFAKVDKHLDLDHSDILLV